MPAKMIDQGLSEISLAKRRMNLQDYARRPETIGRGRDHWGRMGLKTRAEFDAFLLSKERHPESVSYAIAPAKGEAVVAFINDNRWLARCECGGLAVVDPDEPEFYCHACFNMANGGVALGKDAHGGYPRPILFPAPDQQQEIADALMVSDDPLWRNWTPLEEDGADPGSSRVNRVISAEDIDTALRRAQDANEVAGLPRKKVSDVLLG